MRWIIWITKTGEALAPPERHNRRRKCKKGRTKEEKALSSFLLLFLLLSLSLFACKNKAKEYRLLGIEALERGDGKAALENFNLALEKSNGQVSALQMDILAYKIEAEILLGNISDAEASLENYKALAKKDLPLLEERIAGKKLIQELGTALNDNKLEDAEKLLQKSRKRDWKKIGSIFLMQRYIWRRPQNGRKPMKPFSNTVPVIPGMRMQKGNLAF